MSANLFDPDDMAEQARAMADAAEQSVHELIAEVDYQLMVAEAERISGDSQEHAAVMWRLGEYLDDMDRDLIVTALIRLRTPNANERAERVLDRASDWLDLHIGAATTPKQVAADELDVCPDPAGHDREWRGSELSFWQRARKPRGRHTEKAKCEYCGRKIR